MIALGHVLQAPQRRLLHASARRIEQGARRRCEEAIDDRRSLRRACRDRALQVLRAGQLGQGQARARDDRRRQGARPRRRLRFLSLRGRHQSAEEPAAAMGAGRRRRRDAGAAQAAGDARAHPRRHRARRAQQLGPHPVMGLRADLDLAQPAAACRPHHRRARGRARPRPDRHASRDYLVDDKGATRVLVTSISEDDIRDDRGVAARRWSAPTAIASRPTARSARACRIRASTAPSRASSAITSASRAALPLELAVHKMTGATARALKLADRGLLREGYRADVTIFDPADFRDRATYARSAPVSERRPHQRDRQRRRSWSRTRPIPARCRARCCAATAPAKSAEATFTRTPRRLYRRTSRSIPGSSACGCRRPRPSG